MGVMERFRQSTKYILWLLIISFGLLWALSDVNFFDALAAGPRTLGSVNGKAITFQAYNNRVNAFSERYRFETGTSATAELRAYYEELAWDELVNDLLLTQKMEELGIKVSDQELVDMVMGAEPDPFIAQYFTREDGTIDRMALQNAIESPELTATWIQIEQQLREKRKREKFTNLIQASFKVSDADVEREYLNQNTTANVDFIRVPFSEIADDQIQVSDKELRDYYNTNKDKFKVKRTWRIEFVSFDKTPTREDTVKTYDEVNEIREEFLVAKNDSTFFSQYNSVLPYSKTVTKRSELKKEYKPLEKLKVGGVTEVITDEFKRLHLLKLLAITKDEVTFIDFARQVEADPLGTIEDRAREADDFLYFARETNFQKEAEARNLIIEPALTTEGGTFIPTLGQARQVNKALERMKRGDISDVIEMSDKFVVFRVVEANPAGYRPFDEVKAQIEVTVKGEKRAEMTLRNVEAAHVRHAGDLDALAQALGKTATKDELVRASSLTMPGTGREPRVIGAIFNMDAGSISKPIKGQNAVFVVKVNSVSRPELNALNIATKQSIRTRLEQQRSQQFSQVWLNELKEAADIVDNRTKVLRYN